MRRLALLTAALCGLHLGLAPAPALAVTPALVDCPYLGTVGDNWGVYGFYVPSYPGINLQDVTLYLQFPEAGTYQVSLIARRDAFNGPMVGTSPATVEVTSDRFLPITFRFDSAAVPAGSTLVFETRRDSGPSGTIFFAVLVPDGCPVYQTENFNPPLGGYRRAGIAVRITGDPDPAGRLTVITVPAVVSNRGLNETFFHSDVALFNRISDSITVKARYRCQAGQNCGTGEATFDMPAFSSKTIPDVVSTLFGASQSSGALEFSYRSPWRRGDELAVFSRVYTPELPKPTNGAAVPGLPSGQAMGKGIFLGLANNGGDLSAGFRSNAGIYNPWGFEISATFDVYRTEGRLDSANRLGSFSATWGPYESRQINDIFKAAGAESTVTLDGMLRMTATAPVFGYVTVIDNGTGDSVFQTPKPF
ncbi:MAG: hypothetical protein IT186_08350 [Acidobacteria bacterium]|nr:hypothetical protein [Acidobacteriota bacterium]MCG3193125.1 hypothetical protein [Thermoanaerobaculia bacterium]